MKRFRSLLISIVFILAMLPTAHAIGYAPTTIYGWVSGNDKFSVAMIATDSVTGERIDADVLVSEDLFITTITTPDNGHEILITLRVNHRGGTELITLRALPWSLHNINISIPDGSSPTFTKTEDPARGPSITPIIRDSEEDIDTFKELHPEPRLLPSAFPSPENPAPIETRTSGPQDTLLFVIIMFSSIVMISLIVGERHKKGKEK